MKKGVAILGSTGSIGTQALEVIEQHSTLFSVEVLTANNNADLLIRQAKIFQPKAVVITNESLYIDVKESLSNLPIEVLGGSKSLNEVVGYSEVDIVLTALVGYAGLESTIEAIKHKKDIALANKETLVVAGELINSLKEKHSSTIIPVDSEHSAIFQCLVGESYDSIRKVILTASGGPFRGKTKKDLSKVTRDQALKHPNWDMGAKITIDSATMMNKGLEVIEAKWLFDLSEDQIDVVVHPESIIHSMVLFNDGSIKAQMGLPDMKVPIAYALNYPVRRKVIFENLNLPDIGRLNFENPDYGVFRNLNLAYEAMKKAGNMPCILNAANEIAVERFLKKEIDFLDIARVNEESMSKVGFIESPSLQDYIDTDLEARSIAKVI